MLANPGWEQKQLFNLGKPSLKTLSTILRDRGLWPKGFEWYYGSCDKCAMGIAHQLWGDYIRAPVPIDMSRALRMPIKDIRHLFTEDYDENWYRDVTPEMVADRIDEYLSKT